MVADNLPAHALGGFSCAFRALGGFFCALLLGFDGDEYLLGIIECIIVHKAKVYSHAEKMETVSYHFHFNAFEVIGTTPCLVLGLEKLVSCHPLGSYKINDMFLIELNIIIM